MKKAGMIVFFLALGAGLFFLFPFFSSPPNTFEEETSPEVARLNNEAMKAFEAGDLPKAQSLFQKVLEKEPKSSKVYSNLSSVRAALKDFSGALQYIQKAMDLRPTHLPFQLKKVQYLVPLMRWKEAREEAEKLCQKNPSFWEAWLEWAQIELWMGNREASFQILSKINSTDKKVLYIRGRVLFEMDKFQEAEKELKKIPVAWRPSVEWLCKVNAAQEKGHEARNILQKILSEGKWKPQDYYSLKLEMGDLWKMTGHFKEALSSYEDVENELSENPYPTMAIYLWKAKNRKILLQMEEGKWQEAFLEWEKYISQAPGTWKVSGLLWQGICLVFLKKEKEALSCWEKAWNLIPQEDLEALEGKVSLSLLREGKLLPHSTILGKRYDNNRLFFQGIQEYLRSEKKKSKEYFEEGLEKSRGKEFPYYLLKLAVEQLK